MTKQLFWLALVPTLASACAPPAKRSVETGVDTAGVRAAFFSLVAAVKRLDATATLAAYDTNSAFAHVFDGNLVRSRVAYDGVIKSMYPTLKAIDSHIDSVFVVPLSPGAAVVIAAYHETVTDTARHETAERGMWTNVFVRRADGWKIAAGHSTHVALPAK